MLVVEIDWFEILHIALIQLIIGVIDASTAFVPDLLLYTDMVEFIHSLLVQVLKVFSRTNLGWWQRRLNLARLQFLCKYVLLLPKHIRIRNFQTQHRQSQFILFLIVFNHAQLLQILILLPLGALRIESCINYSIHFRVHHIGWNISSQGIDATDASCDPTWVCASSFVSNNMRWQSTHWARCNRDKRFWYLKLRDLAHGCRIRSTKYDLVFLVLIEITGWISTDLIIILNWSVLESMMRRDQLFRALYF